PREDEDAIARNARRRAVGHRRSLREAGEDELLVRPELLDDAAHIVDIVVDGELAILARHPIRDDLFASRVEPIEGLDGDERPVDIELLQLRKMAFGVLAVTMKADQQAIALPSPDQIATVG